MEISQNDLLCFLKGRNRLSLVLMEIAGVQFEIAS